MHTRARGTVGFSRVLRYHQDILRRVGTADAAVVWPVDPKELVGRSMRSARLARLRGTSAKRTREYGFSLEYDRAGVVAREAALGNMGRSRCTTCDVCSAVR